MNKKPQQSKLYSQNNKAKRVRKKLSHIQNHPVFLSCALRICTHHFCWIKKIQLVFLIFTRKKRNELRKLFCIGQNWIEKIKGQCRKKYAQWMKKEQKVCSATAWRGQVKVWMSNKLNNKWNALKSKVCERKKERGRRRRWEYKMRTAKMVGIQSNSLVDWKWATL